MASEWLFPSHAKRVHYNGSIMPLPYLRRELIVWPVRDAYGVGTCRERLLYCPQRVPRVAQPPAGAESQRGSKTCICHAKRMYRPRLVPQANKQYRNNVTPVPTLTPLYTAHLFASVPMSMLPHIPNTQDRKL